MDLGLWIITLEGVNLPFKTNKHSRKVFDGDGNNIPSSSYVYMPFIVIPKGSPEH
jgi:hypothetical protein